MDSAVNCSAASSWDWSCSPIWAVAITFAWFLSSILQAAVDIIIATKDRSYSLPSHSHPPPTPTPPPPPPANLSMLSSESHCAFWNFRCIISKTHHALDLSPLPSPPAPPSLLHFSYCLAHGSYLRNLLPLRSPQVLCCFLLSVCPKG